jgi:hypothetical protein
MDGWMMIVAVEQVGNNKSTKNNLSSISITFFYFSNIERGNQKRHTQLGEKRDNHLQKNGTHQ